MPKFYPSPQYDSAVVRSSGDEISLAVVSERCLSCRVSSLAQLEEQVTLDLGSGVGAPCWAQRSYYFAFIFEIFAFDVQV